LQVNIGSNGMCLRKQNTKWIYDDVSKTSFFALKIIKISGQKSKEFDEKNDIIKTTKL